MVGQHLDLDPIASFLPCIGERKQYLTGNRRPGMFDEAVISKAVNDIIVAIGEDPARVKVSDADRKLGRDHPRRIGGDVHRFAREALPAEFGPDGDAVIGCPVQISAIKIFALILVGRHAVRDARFDQFAQG